MTRTNFVRISVISFALLLAGAVPFAHAGGITYGGWETPYYADTSSINYGGWETPYYGDTSSISYGGWETPYYADTSSINYGGWETPYYDSGPSSFENYGPSSFENYGPSSYSLSAPTQAYQSSYAFNDCYTYYGCNAYYLDTPVYSTPNTFSSYDYSYDYVYEREVISDFDDDDRDDDEPSCDIEADDTSIDEDDSTRIHWESDDANSARLNQGIGSVSLDGSRTVSPNSDTTYTLTVRDNDGDTDTCSVTIRVEEDDDNDDEDPSCRLTVDDKTVDEGEEVTLEWDTRNADSASINQGIGRVDEDGGEEDVEVDEDTTFRMTVRDNDGDTDTCSVTVRVDEDRTFSSVEFEGGPTYNPPVVYLSSIPYTGLEDISPAMLSFFVMLIALAGAGAWVTFRSGVIPNFAFATTEEEAVDEGHADADGHVQGTPEADALIAALSAGDTGKAVNTLRDAAVKGAGIEETVKTALETTN
ncbi:MAG: hypothetical protein WBK28_00005, partial [Minisyncoccia bacterium]